MQVCIFMSSRITKKFQIDRWMDGGWVSGCIDGWMDKRMYKLMVGGCIDGWMDGWMKRMDEQVDVWLDGQMGSRWMDRGKDG